MKKTYITGRNGDYYPVSAGDFKALSPISYFIMKLEVKACLAFSLITNGIKLVQAVEVNPSLRIPEMPDDTITLV